MPRSNHDKHFTPKVGIAQRFVIGGSTIWKYSQPYGQNRPAEGGGMFHVVAALVYFAITIMLVLLLL